jgi:predicted ribosomally synthesized peptide with nif11-like leader
MSKENMIGFLQELGKRPEMLERLINLGKNKSLLSFAQEAGFDVTADDLKEMEQFFITKKLSDEDLDKVSAGQDSTDQAYMLSDQSAATTVQDACDMLRNVTSMADTAQGKAFWEFLPSSQQ